MQIARVAFSRSCSVLFALCIAPALASGEIGKVETLVPGNPLRKIESMFQMMTKQVEAEDGKQEELYNKFMCYCKESMDELKKSLAECEVKVPQLITTTMELEASLSKLKQEVENERVDLAEAKAAIAAAAEIRKIEAAAVTTDKWNNSTSIAALKKSIAAIENGISDGFLQTGSAHILVRPVKLSKRLLDDEKMLLYAFIDAPTRGNENIVQSQEIVTILTQLLDELEASRKDATDTETQAVSEFKLFLRAKLREIAALSESIEAKLTLIGELSGRAAAVRRDLDGTEEACGHGRGILVHLGRTCATRTTAREETPKTRAAELLSLAESFEMLDIFRKTLPRASLLQMQVTNQALQRMQSSITGRRSPKFDIIALVLRSRTTALQQDLSLLQTDAIASPKVKNFLRG